MKQLKFWLPKDDGFSHLTIQSRGFAHLWTRFLGFGNPKTWRSYWVCGLKRLGLLGVIVGDRALAGLDVLQRPPKSPPALL